MMCADAALDRNRTLSALREKVATWMSEAEKRDREEEKRPEEDGNGLPPELARKAELSAGTHPEVSRRPVVQGQGSRAGERRERTGEGPSETTEGPLRGRKPKRRIPCPTRRTSPARKAES
ncbi:MAG: hypothetical protein ACYCTV_00445 [Leptospirales bacterium]